MPAGAGADDIIDALEPAMLPVHEFPWVVALIGAALVVLAALAVLIYRRRSRTRIEESPEERARRRLREVRASPGLDARAFHAELSAILVRYAEERLGLRGTRLTSAEILREFRRNSVMSAAWQGALGEFLRECDRAKFAPDLAAEWDPQERVAQCRALLEELAATAAAAPHLASPWEGWSNAAV
jgi:hypothetical protein